MASVYDNPQLDQARTQAQSSAQAAASAETAGMTLPDMLRDALNKKFSIDNPLVQGREQAASRYLTETTQAPLDYTARSAGGRSDVIYSPLEQSNLINARRTSALAPLTSANYLLDLSRGGIDDIIDATSRSYGAYTNNLTNRASLDRQAYADLFGETQARADEAYKNRSLDISASKAANTTRKIPARLGTAVGDFNSIQSTINQLVDYGKKIKTKLGKDGVVGRGQSAVSVLKAQIGNDPDFKQFMNLQEALKSAVAKGVGRETGVLTEGDIKRAAAALPDPYGTQKEFENSLKTLRDIQKNAKVNLQKQFTLYDIPYDEGYINNSVAYDVGDNDYEAIFEMLGL